MDKNSFLLHKNHKEIFESLPKEQAADLLLAIFDYEETHTEPELDGVLKLVFIPIRQWLDEKRESYKATCKKNAENGKKGGRPKKQTDNKETPKTQKTQRLSDEPKKAEYEYDYDSDYDSDYEGTSVPNSAREDEPKKPKDQKQGKELKYPDNFIKFWDMYPRKVNKQNAFKAWKKLKVNDVMFAKIINGLKRANDSPEWVKNIKEQTLEFIPHASTWLNGRRWEDEIDPEGGPKKTESKYAKAWGAKTCSM